jgi:PIN domain nuclease of toxin-antitoxin system
MKLLLDTHAFLWFVMPLAISPESHGAMTTFDSRMQDIR